MASATAVRAFAAESAKHETHIVCSSPLRVASVDLLRGTVMVLMALDHSRRFLSNLEFSPENLAHTSAPLFFTRFVTHFCAPVFFFLAGTGAFLSLSRGRTSSEISKFLVTRGLWLMLLDSTLIAYAWAFSIGYLHAGVLWCLGCSMIVLAILVRLPLPGIATIGLTMICTHNLLDGITPSMLGRFSWVWFLLHRPGQFSMGSTGVPMLVTFPLVPWVGVMLLGYSFGPLIQRRDRQKILLLTGAALTVAFFLLRGFNLYGNGSVALQPVVRDSAGPWKVQPTLAMTAVSFFNTLKFPPSLQFLLMTIGPALIALACLEKISVQSAVGRSLLVFGRVPLFFYTLHLFLIHTAAVWIALAWHQPAAWLLYGGFMLNRIPGSYGHGLPFVYAAWVIFLLTLYFPCHWFMAYKQQHRQLWWISYA